MAVTHTPESATRRDARRTGRVRLEMVSSDWGKVLDVSRGGLRVRGPRHRAAKVGATVPIRLETCQTTITVPGRIVWKRTTGLLVREMGFEFDGIGEDQQRFLLALARSCAGNEHVRHPIFRKSG